MNNRKGFTLLELMAVVAIVAILSAMALGGYRKSIERAAFNEGKQVLHSLAAAADSHYYENRSFPSGLCNLEVTISGVLNNVSCTTQQTKNFTYAGILHTGTDYYLEASANTGSGATLRVYLEGNGPAKSDGSLKRDECRGNEDFCKSMGYSDCASSVCREKTMD
ncbi:MAG: prepilin-type N-terminal cleavage/methylation domain-containing protein [Elusimicrobiaceae bacterium]|nr:prepilin-type N-terminal cleavage/methylation domain-containing protein [Elusimicrobiaceae bacterium]